MKRFRDTCVKKWKQILGQKNFLKGNIERT